MVGKLLKMYLYAKLPREGLALLHPVKSRRAKKVPGHLRSAYAPRVAALATALLVGPLAYRLGRRSTEGTLLTPRTPSTTPPPTLPPA